MSTYIGKVQIGSELASIGSTLYGICTTAADTAAKQVTLSDFDQDLHGVTIFVRFNNGNTILSNVTLTVGGASAHNVLGNCLCDSNEILAFTMDRTNSSGIISETTSDWHWIVVGHVANTIEIATATPSAISTTANVGSSTKYAKEDHVHNIVVAEGDANGQIKIAGQNIDVHGLGSAAYTSADTYAPKNNPTFTGNVIVPALTINGSDGDNEAANKKYVDDKVANILAGADAMTFKGTIGTTGNIQTLPDGTSGHTYVSGDTYRVVSAGNYGTVEKPLQCEEGDLIIAINNSTENQSAVNSDHWTVVQGNLDGTVSGPVSSTDGHIALWDGTTGRLLKNSEYTIATSVPANAVFTDHQYTLTTGANAYTGTTTYNANDTNTKTLVSVSQGILILQEGITFTTTAVGTALADA